MVNRLSLVGAQIGGVTFERAAAADTVPTDWRTVTPGYFEALGIPVREGRLFDGRDTPDSVRVGIVDDRLTRTIAPGGNLIGRRFRIGENAPWTEVVEVVGHVRTDGLDVDPRPQVYWPHWQRAQEGMVLVVVSIVAVAIPARRAAHVDPATTLRTE